MRRLESKGSPKKTAKNTNNFRSLDLHNICIRLNQIIERSNAIDNQLSKYEKQITTNKITPISIQEDPISEYGSHSPESKYRFSNSSPKNSFSTTISSINSPDAKSNASVYNENPIVEVTKTVNSEEKQISLNDLYLLMIDLKLQVTEIAKNQLKMEEEIRKLAESK